MKNIKLGSFILGVSILLVPFFAGAHSSEKMEPDLDVIQTAEKAYFSNHGSYFGVGLNDQLFPTEPGVLADYVNPKAVPPNTAISFYQAPSAEWGYFVYWMILPTKHKAGSRNWVGYGPEAQDFTSTTVLPPYGNSTSTHDKDPE